MEPQQHDIHDAYQLLVHGGVQHQAAIPALYLRSQLDEGLSLTLAELCDVDVVIRQHLGDELRGPLGVLQVKQSRPLEGGGPGRLDLLLVPPLVLHGAPRVLVEDREPLGQEVCLAITCTLVPRALAAMLVVQTLHELPPAPRDAVADALGPQAAHVYVLRLGGLLHHLVVVALLPRFARDPDVRGKRVSAGPPLLVLQEHALQAVLAVRVYPLQVPRLFPHDVALILEGKLAGEEAVHDDAQSPYVDLKTIVPLEDLWGPKNLCAHLLAEALLGPKMA
mmetsp:Transcript_71235/g.201894  ORF Transcript_71235/g.201894 Transcript_71235/m.201894 type:complete len:279 (+) Transcript_71235:1050-1886(+)